MSQDMYYKHCSKWARTFTTNIIVANEPGIYYKYVSCSKLQILRMQGFDNLRCDVFKVDSLSDNIC